MTQLTQEDREFVEQERSHATAWIHKMKCEGKIALTDEKILNLISLIDRLSARVEELEANLNKTAEAHVETQGWWNETSKNLSSLLSAVEPIVKEFHMATENFWNKPVKIHAVGPKSFKLDKDEENVLRLSDKPCTLTLKNSAFLNLDSAVRKAGGKGC